jgi:hypothetical protein
LTVADYLNTAAAPLTPGVMRTVGTNRVHR